MKRLSLLTKRERKSKLKMLFHLNKMDITRNTCSLLMGMEMAQSPWNIIWSSSYKQTKETLYNRGSPAMSPKELK